MHEFRLNGVDLGLPAGLATPAIREKLADGTYEEDEGARRRTLRAAGVPGARTGAGIGYVTALCAQRAGPENVLSVEANPDLLPVIEANLARNGLSGVSVMHGAATGPVEEGAMARIPPSRTATPAPASAGRDGGCACR